MILREVAMGGTHLPIGIRGTNISHGGSIRGELRRDTLFLIEGTISGADPRELAMINHESWLAMRYLSNIN